MNTTFILRNKQFNKLTEIEKQEVINQVRKAYLENNMKIDELISMFNSTKTFMYDFLRKNNIKKSKEQLNAERSKLCKKAYHDKSNNEINKIKEKRKQTNMERFGVENPYQSKEIQDKIKQKNLELYGVEYATQRKDVKEKIDKSTLESQGAKRYLQTEEGQNKFKQSCLEKYGVENPYQSEQKKEKIKQTNLKKYGNEIPCRTKNIKNKMKENSLIKWGTEYPSQCQEIKNKVMNTNLQRFGLPWSCMRLECKLAQGGISYTNNEFANLLKLNNIEFEREVELKHVSYDFKIGTTLVEIDPTYTHNSTKGPYFNKHYTNPKQHDYHLNKSNIAQENGYFCIHLFDWDNKHKIINMFIKKQKLYARNCEIKEVKKKECDDFLNFYHLQNTCNGQKIRYGLYYNDQLVEVMTFGKPRYNKNYEWELLRLCSHKDYKIVGGSERLFKYFLREQNPQSIISYCDNSKFSGDVYERLGMELINISNPACIWSKGKIKITDNLLRQQGFDRLFGTSYGKGTSNRELILNEGFVEVYDCGQKSFKYINTSI